MLLNLMLSRAYITLAIEYILFYKANDSNILLNFQV